MQILRGLAAALVFCVFAVPAAAQQRDSAAGSIATEPKAPALPQVIAAVNAQAARVDSLATVKDLNASKVRFVDITPLLDETNGKVIDSLTTVHAEPIGKMRTAVQENAVLKPLLEPASVKPEQIVALDIDATGTVWVFYRK